MSALALGIDVGGSKVDVAVARRGEDPAGAVLWRRRIPTAAEAGAEEVLRRTIEAARAALAAVARPGRSTVTAVGVSTIGVPRPGGGILLAENIPGWERLDLSARLREGLDVEDVRVDNDVKLGALAELVWGHLAGVAEAIYLNLGTGIAAALVSGGVVVRGAHGAAGEIGYQVRCGRGPAGDGERLEAWAGGGALLARARELDPGITAERLYAAGNRPAAVGALVDAALDDIARHVANLAVALDPARIVVNGGTMRAADMVLPLLRSRLEAVTLFPPLVTAGRFPFDAPLMGALTLAGAQSASMERCAVVTSAGAAPAPSTAMRSRWSPAATT